MHTEPAHESSFTSVTAAQNQSSPGCGGPVGAENHSDAGDALARGHVTQRGRMGRVGGVRIAGTGSFVPENVVTNEDLAALGCDSDWIIRRTGISERRHAGCDEATSDMCYHAAVRCLENAGVGVEEVDLILVATITPDHPTPSTSCQLQGRLGASAPAMDLAAACSGFTYGLVTAAQFVACGNAKNVLVVGADLMSRTIDPDDKKTYPLFGDAAAAVLLTSVSNDSAPHAADPVAPTEGGTIGGPDRADDGLIAYQLGSDGVLGEMLCVPAGGSRQPLTPEAHAAGDHYMKMDGRNVFKWAVRVVEESAKDVMAHASVTANDLSMLVLHQANLRIIDSAATGLGIDPSKVYVNLDRFGNTSAASIPLALDEASRAGRLQRGDLVLMSGFGAGLAWGTLLLRW